MHIFTSIVISALMILGATTYQEKNQSFGANSTISNLPELTALDGEDLFATVDTSASQTKKLTWDTATSSMKVILDSIYSPIFSTSAGFFGLISDETGTAGGVVRATSPTLTTPTLSAPTLDVAGTDATGDIYYNGGSGLMTRLPIGSNGEYLRLDGGLPDWDNTGLLTNPQVSSSTFTGTTSISASNVNSNALILNQLAYSFPSTRGASSSVLTENGSGGLRWYTPSSLVLYQSSGSTTVSSSATTSALIVPVPAGTIATSSLVRITAFTCNSGGTNQRYEITFGTGSATATLAQFGGLNLGNPYGNKIVVNMYNHTNKVQNSSADLDFANAYGLSSLTQSKVYHAIGNVDTSNKSYFDFRAGESGSAAENGYCGITVELLKQ